MAQKVSSVSESVQLLETRAAHAAPILARYPSSVPLRRSPSPAVSTTGIEAFRRAFDQRMGAGGTVRVFFSPGRVNLMGAHLDYNGGPVMPTAIDRGTFLAVRVRPDRVLRLASRLDGAALEARLDELPPRAAGAWFDYPLGVVHHLLLHRPDAPGLDVFFGGNLPIGAGLSSSASICVGTALALDALWELGGTVQDHIAAALFAEREFVGVQCGIMDPYAVAMARPGHLLWLDCKDRSTEHLPLDASELAIVVADTGIRRELARSEFNRRVDECRRAFEALRPHVPGATCLRDVPLQAVEDHAAELEPTALRRARHVASEVARTLAARDALLRGDVAGFGAQLFHTHASLRDLFEVSIPELDAIVDAARAWEGVLGARLTGAGFGGCAVVLVRRAAAEGLARHVAETYERAFGRRPHVETFRGDPGPRELALD